MQVAIKVPFIKLKNTRFFNAASVSDPVTCESCLSSPSCEESLYEQADSKKRKVLQKKIAFSRFTVKVV